VFGRTLKILFFSILLAFVHQTSYVPLLIASEISYSSLMLAFLAAFVIGLSKAGIEGIATVYTPAKWKSEISTWSFPHSYSLPAVGGLKFIAYANAPTGSFAKNICRLYSVT